MVKYIQQFHDTKQLTILEIGSWTGVSAEIFAQHFKWVYCVDPWESTKGISTKYNMKQVEKIFHKRMSKYNNYIIHKMTSKEYKNCVGKAIYDIIYIDGLHTYEAVKEDIELWKDKATLYLTGHDYWPGKFPGVIKAVNETFGKPDKVFPDTSWLIDLKARRNNG
jgi:hypothetical protein